MVKTKDFLVHERTTTAGFLESHAGSSREVGGFVRAQRFCKGILHLRSPLALNHARKLLFLTALGRCEDQLDIYKCRWIGSDHLNRRQNKTYCYVLPQGPEHLSPIGKISFRF